MTYRNSIVAGLALVALLTPACKEETANATDNWSAAGLSASPFESAEPRYGATSCSSSKVSGIYVSLCEFADSDAAAKAHDAAVQEIGNSTGLALARDKVLLVADDRDKIDPSGRTMNKVARAFWEDGK